MERIRFVSDSEDEMFQGIIGKTNHFAPARDDSSNVAVSVIPAFALGACWIANRIGQTERVHPSSHPLALRITNLREIERVKHICCCIMGRSNDFLHSSKDVMHELSSISVWPDPL